MMPHVTRRHTPTGSLTSCRAARIARRLGSVIVLVILLTACSLSTVREKSPTAAPTVDMPADTAPLVVAWMQNGDLITWRSDAPELRRIASGSVIRPFIAPDGAAIAYTRGPGGDTRSLWISDTPGTAERQIVDAPTLGDSGENRRLGQIVWSPDSSLIFFNTITGESIATRPADDLWRVDPVTGTPERLLPDGSGGMITPSPDGRWLALATAGIYQEASGRIAFYNVASGQMSRALEFPAVATGSERRWYANLQWTSDSSTVYTAIPPADLIYGQTGDTALWMLPTSGEPEQIGQAAADFFGVPTFSPDGAWIVYLQRRTSAQQTAVTLMLAHGDGTGTAPYMQGDVGTLVPSGWLPQSNQFLYMQGAPGETWLGQPDADPVRFPAADIAITEIAWADPNTYVFSTSGDSATFTLRFGLLDVPTPVQTIATLDAYPFFDAVLP